MRIALVNKSDNATLTASSQAAGLVVGNLKTPYKSQVWRSAADTATLTVEWPTGELISVVCLPFCSLSAAATIRVRAYTESSDVSPKYDSGAIVAVPPVDFGDVDWGGEVLGVNAYAYGEVLGVNSYAYGEYSCCVVWIPVDSYEKLIIDIDDSLNTAGYIEAGRLFCSSYYEFTANADYGSSMSFSDNDTQTRTEAGDLLSDKGTVYKTVSIDMSWFPEKDKRALLRLLLSATKTKPLLVQVAEMNDSVSNQHWTIFGKLTRNSEIVARTFDSYNSTLSIEEA